MVTGRRWLLALVALLAALAGAGHAAEPAPVPEPQLKAVCLFYFAKFTDWPTNAFANAQSPVRFGVLGDTPVGDDLAQIIKGKTIKGRPVELVRGVALAALRDCHVVFVPRAARDRFANAPVADRPVLTVGETPEFLHQGGMIRFVIVDGKVRFLVNKAAIDAAGLGINSEVLRLAERSAPATPGTDS